MTLPEKKKLLFESLIREYKYFIRIADKLYFYNNGIYEQLTEKYFKKISYKMLDLNYDLKFQYNDKIINDVFSLILNHPDLQDIKDEEIEKNNKYIAFKNCLFDIEKCEFINHNPDIYLLSNIDIDMTNITINRESYNYINNDYNMPNFITFLHEKMNANNKMVNSIFEFIGYCLSDYIGMKTVFIFLGESNTGKSTFLNFIERLIGKENFSHVPFNELADKFKTSSLYGKKINNGGEIGTIPLNNEGIFKQLTGQDSLSIEFKNKDPFSFTNRAKLIFCLNYINDLKITNKDTKAIMNRLTFFEFNGIIEKENMNHNIIDIWLTEKNTIIQHALAGIYRLKQNNFRFSADNELILLKDNYLLESNKLERFIEQYCIVIPSEKLKRAYKKINRTQIYMTIEEFHEKYCNFLGKDIAKNSLEFREVKRKLKENWDIEPVKRNAVWVFLGVSFQYLIDYSLFEALIFERVNISPVIDKVFENGYLERKSHIEEFFPHLLQETDNTNQIYENNEDNTANSYNNAEKSNLQDDKCSGISSEKAREILKFFSDY